MFYRRKVILSFLQNFNNELNKIKLQKLLFLFTQEQAEKVYDFIPYKYGAYSCSASADMSAMSQKGILIDRQKSFFLNDATDYFAALKPEDQHSLQKIKSTFGRMSNNDLMRYTYNNYPYWAINSATAQNLLSRAKYELVMQSKPKSARTILFTIGYEGISLEEYLNRLIRNDVKILVDVRCNPLSMKFGFNKSQLQRYCKILNIEYAHFPEVGIQSEDRKCLRTQKDYDNLFIAYRKNNLAKTLKTQLVILDLLKQRKRIALTCFEADINQCHRKHLAEAISHLPNFNYQLKHI